MVRVDGVVVVGEVAVSQFPVLAATVVKVMELESVLCTVRFCDTGAEEPVGAVRLTPLALRLNSVVLLTKRLTGIVCGALLPGMDTLMVPL